MPPIVPLLLLLGLLQLMASIIGIEEDDARWCCPIDVTVIIAPRLLLFPLQLLKTTEEDPDGGLLLGSSECPAFGVFSLMIIV